MEHLHFTFFCCRHAVVLIRHQWARLAPAVAGGEWRGALRARRAKVNA